MRIFVAILKSNSRLPGSLYGDLSGQVSALDLGERRLNDLLEEYGEGTVTRALVELKKSAAKLMASYIKDIPDGTYSAEDWLDNDGIVDEPLKIALDVTISGDQMTLDFSRTSDACDGPVNISRSTCVAACYVAMKHIFRDVPANAGVLEPINFIIPETSLLSAVRPKPVGGYTETILRIIDVIFVAISQVAPEMTNGCAYGTINALSLAGYRKNGARWVMFSFLAGVMVDIPSAMVLITVTHLFLLRPFRLSRFLKLPIRCVLPNGRCAPIVVARGEIEGGAVPFMKLSFLLIKPMHFCLVNAGNLHHRA